MLHRGLLKAVTTVIAATCVAASFSLPASASATHGATARAHGTTVNKYRIMQRGVCLDAGFEFSKCIYGPNPEDPPALEKWVLVPAANGSVQIKNDSQCLDVTSFTLPCAKGDPSQRWFRVSAGNGLVHVVNRSTSPAQCLDSFWTTHPCVRGDKDQIWRFKLAS